MKKHRSALILMVMDQTAAGGNGSLAEVELLHSRLCFRPENLQAEYDLASVGEVESVSRPHGDPPKWTVEYKERLFGQAGCSHQSESLSLAIHQATASQRLKILGIPRKR
jgi:hypothetical protein